MHMHTLGWSHIKQVIGTVYTILYTFSLFVVVCKLVIVVQHEGDSHKCQSENLTP